MAQEVCSVVSGEDRARLETIVADRNRAQKHVLRARIVLHSAERLNVAEVARRVGASRPAVWRWQRRYAVAGVDGLVREGTVVRTELAARPSSTLSAANSVVVPLRFSRKSCAGSTCVAQIRCTVRNDSPIRPAKREISRFPHREHPHMLRRGWRVADPGGIWISGSALEQVRDHGGALADGFEDLGERQVVPFDSGRFRLPSGSVSNQVPNNQARRLANEKARG